MSDDSEKSIIIYPADLKDKNEEQLLIELLRSDPEVIYWEKDQDYQVGEKTIQLKHPILKRKSSKQGNSDQLRYEVLRDPIGTGASGTAYKTKTFRIEQDRIKYSLKKRTVKTIPSSKITLEQAKAEAKLAAEARFFKIKEPFEENRKPNPMLTINYLHLVMQYIEGDLLFSIIDRDLNTNTLPESRLSYDDRKKYMLQLVQAGLQLKENKIVHQDIKPENIIRKSDGSFVMIDFGLATRYGTAKNSIDPTLTRLGTPGYAPPELFEEKYQKESADYPEDVFSLGIIFAVLFGDTDAINNIKEKSLPYEAINSVTGENLFVKLPEKQRQSIPEEEESALRKIIQSMLQKDPKKRMTLEEVKQLLEAFVINNAQSKKDGWEFIKTFVNDYHQTKPGTLTTRKELFLNDAELLEAKRLQVLKLEPGTTQAVKINKSISKSKVVMIAAGIVAFLASAKAVLSEKVTDDLSTYVDSSNVNLSNNEQELSKSFTNVEPNVTNFPEAYHLMFMGAAVIVPLLIWIKRKFYNSHPSNKLTNFEKNDNIQKTQDISEVIKNDAIALTADTNLIKDLSQDNENRPLPILAEEMQHPGKIEQESSAAESKKSDFPLNLENQPDELIKLESDEAKEKPEPEALENDVPSSIATEPNQETILNLPVDTHPDYTDKNLVNDSSQENENNSPRPLLAIDQKNQGEVDKDPSPKGSKKEKILAQLENDLNNIQQQCTHDKDSVRDFVQNTINEIRPELPSLINSISEGKPPNKQPIKTILENNLEDYKKTKPDPTAMRRVMNLLNKLWNAIKEWCKASLSSVKRTSIGLFSKSNKKESIVDSVNPPSKAIK